MQKYTEDLWTFSR